MSLCFPNSSRSYDPTRRRVRFWGYERALEIAFFIDADALTAAASQTEVAVLQAFDDGRERIHKVAAAVHGRAPGFTHVLTAADF